MWNKCLRLFWLGKRTDLVGGGSAARPTGAD